MRIDDKIVELARSSDMIDFFERRYGVTFTRRYGSYRCKQRPSLAVKGDRHCWFWHSRGIGGFGPLDYLMKIERLPFRDAVSVVEGFKPTSAATRLAERSKTLRLPPKNDTSIHLSDYLCNKRGIDGQIVQALVQLGALYEAKNRNCVFVGFDEYGKPRFANVRGTYGNRPFRYDCAGSDKRYAFCMESSHSSRLYVLESSIDAMSRATLENIFSNDKDAWTHRNYISLAGTSDTALSFFLNKRPDVKELLFCLDNDHAGQNATATMVKKFESMRFHVQIERPFHKDCNEDLIVMLKGDALCL